MPVATLREEYEQRKKARREAPETLTNRERTIRLFERLIPVLVPVAGGLWAVILFTNSQGELAVKAAAEQAAQSRTRLVEAQKPFIDLQFATYKELTLVLGQLLIYNNGERERWDKMYDVYLRMTTGPMRF